jgi:PPOX class probable F420-dependent enzyme
VARDAIRLSPAEIDAYLAEQKVIQVATMGPHGRPHLAPLWFVPRHSTHGLPVLATWTYSKSQKALNLHRDPRATVLVEDGESYSKLRGVSMECDVTLLEDYEPTLQIGLALAERYGTEGYEADRTLISAAFEAQARKRVGIVLTVTKVASWDHSKLGGAS